MNQWNVIRKLYDGVEDCYDIEFTHNAVFVPEVDGHEYREIRITEEGVIRGLIQDGMYISDDVTDQFELHGYDTKQLYFALETLDKFGLLHYEDITDEFAEFHKLEDEDE